MHETIRSPACGIWNVNLQLISRRRTGALGMGQAPSLHPGQTGETGTIHGHPEKEKSRDGQHQEWTWPVQTNQQLTHTCTCR